MKHHLFIGIDRSDSHLDLARLEPDGQLVDERRIPVAPETLAPWVDSLRSGLPEGATVALCFEQPCQNLINFFGRFDHLTLFPVNPARLKRYRQSLSDSVAKDDKRDALALGMLVHERAARLTPWSSSDPAAARLALLVEKRRQFVAIRTRLTNKLTQILKECFPQALQLVGRDLHAPLACALLDKYPTLQSIRCARPDTLRRFYHAHGSRRPAAIQRRLDLIARAVPMCDDPDLLEIYTEIIRALVAQIRQGQLTVLRFDQLIEARLLLHPDARLFASLPGAGPTLAARLLAYFGSDRSRFADAAAVHQHSGVAPITKQSGKMRFVHRRYACDKFTRQSFVEWAAQTITRSLWARAYYKHQKSKGQRHHAILRGLAYKWQRILFRCWQTRQTYDETRYLKALENSSSPLVPIIAEIRRIRSQDNDQLCEQS